MKKKKILAIIPIFVLICLIGSGLFLLLSNPTVLILGNKANVDWYDESGKEFTLYTVDEWYGFQKLSAYYDFEGQTIKLGTDIIVNEGNAVDWETKKPERKWFAVKGFAGVFDGQGHTISGIYAKGTDIGVSLFSDTKSTCIIKNFKLINSYFEGFGNYGTASILGLGSGKLEKIYTDAIVNCKGANTGGVVGRVNSDLTVSECWFDGSIQATQRAVGGIIGKIEEGKVNVLHSLNSGQVSAHWNSSGARVGGICGVVNKFGCEITIEDTLCSGKVTTENNTLTGSIIGVAYPETITNIMSTYGSLDSYGQCIGTGGSQGTMKGSALEIAGEDLNGYRGYQWTDLDFDKFWTVVEEGTPVLRHFAEEIVSVDGVKKVFDIAWYDPDKTDFTLNTIEELYGLYMLSATNDFKGKTIKLGADVFANEGKWSEWKNESPEKRWYPIKLFAGTFDGQGHTISGIYLNSDGYKTGFFSETTTDSVVKNFKLVNSYFNNTKTGDVLMGSIAGSGNGIFESLYSDAYLSGCGIAVGGFLGNTKGAGTHQIKNCWFDGTISMKGEGGRYAGGLIGTVTGGITSIEHCLVTGTISCEATKAGSHIGGFVSSTINSTTVLKITDSLSAGSISVKNHYQVGSIVGRLQKDTNGVIDNVYAVQECYEKTVGYVDGGTQTGDAVVYGRNVLVGNGGFHWTNLDFEQYWAISLQSIPVLKSFTSNIPSVAGLKKYFDIDWYKKEATSFTLKDVEDLYGLYFLSAYTDFKGKTVKLGKDIVVNSGNASEWGKTPPTKMWYPIRTFAGCFDGQGHTISGVYLDTALKKGGLFTETTTDGVIKNFRLINSYFNYSSTGDALIGSVVGRGNGTLDTVYSEAIICSSGIGSGGLVGQTNGEGTHKIVNSWFAGELRLQGEAGRYGAGIVGTVTGGKTEISHCLNTGNITCEATKAGSHIGGFVASTMNKNTVVVLSDCLSAGSIRVANKYQVGSIVGRLQKDTKGTIKNVYATQECYEKTVGYIDGGVQEGDAVVFGNISLLGEGGYQWTDLDFSKYWTIVQNGTPILKKFASEIRSVSGLEKLFDTSWYDAKTNVYQLKNAKDLYGFYVMSSFTDFKGKTVKLVQDITVNTGNAGDWATTSPKMVWYAVKTFAGTFDGTGHTISGLYLNSPLQKVGLFSETTKDSLLKDFRLENSYFNSVVTGEAYIGSIAGRGNGRFEKIYSNAIVSSPGIAVGGLIGQTNGEGTHRISNCWYDGNILLKGENGRYGGGFIGTVTGGTTILEHCLNSAMINCEATKAGSHVGGFVACTMNKGTELMIVDSMNTGLIRVANKYQVGSVLGRAQKNTVVNLESICTTKESYNKAIGYNESSKLEESIITKRTNELKGNGGYLWSALDFDSSWNLVEDALPELRCFAKSESMEPNGSLRMDISWYDGNKTTFEISKASELYGLAYLVNDGAESSNRFKGKTIKLVKNITVNPDNWNAGSENVTVPNYDWVAIGKYVTFQGVFDGQGNVISGLYEVSAEDNIGLFGQVNEYGTIKNVSVKNSYFESAKDTDTYGYIGSIAGYTKGTIKNIYSDATVVSKCKAVGGIVGAVTGKHTRNISNCWYAGTIRLLGENGRYAGGIIGYVNEAGNTTIEHCLNTGKITYEAKNSGPNVAGIVSGTNNGAILTIQDSLSLGSVTSSVSTNGNQVASVIGFVRQGTTVTFENVYASKECRQKPDGTAVTVQYSLGTMNGTVTAMPLNQLEGAGAYQWTQLDFNQYWVAIKDSTPELKSFQQGNAADIDDVIRVDTRWYNHTDNEFTISTTAELYGFAHLVNEGAEKANRFKSKTVKLGADITVNSDEWDARKQKKDGTPNASEPRYHWIAIGKNATFQGTFDGQGHTISGLYESTNGQYVGLFGQVNQYGTIKNLKLKNSFFKTTKNYSSSANAAYIGSIAGYTKGNVDSVYSEAVVYCAGSANRSGGLFGTLSDATTKKISNCQFAGYLVSNGARVGGIAGCVESSNSNTTLQNCQFTGEIFTTQQQTGGLVGYVNAGSLNVQVISCVNSGNMKNSFANNAYVGGLFGLLELGGADRCNILIKDSVMRGEILASSRKYVGSIYGKGYNTSVTFDHVETTDNVRTTLNNAPYQWKNMIGIGWDNQSNYTANVTGEPVIFQEGNK